MSWLTVPGGNIAAGQAMEIEVTFQPLSTGGQDATIEIASDADIHPNDTKELSGNGTESLIGFQPTLTWARC